jgi:hypothetical protein
LRECVIDHNMCVGKKMHRKNGLTITMITIVAPVACLGFGGKYEETEDDCYRDREDVVGLHGCGCLLGREVGYVRKERTGGFR